MAKTKAEIDAELTYYQCCLADLALKYIHREMYGHQNIECLYRKLQFGVLLLESLKCSDRILELEHLTQDEIEVELEKLNAMCNCAACDEPDSITDDTIPTGFP